MFIYAFKKSLMYFLKTANLTGRLQPIGTVLAVDKLASCLITINK